MRKWLVFFCLFFLFLSLITYFFIDSNKQNGNNENVDIYNYNSTSNVEDVDIYEEEKSLNVVKMYRPETNEVESIDYYDYLRGVVASEMPADYSLEALKAQAIVARTFLFKRQNEGHVYLADICSSSSHCQVYKSKDEIFNLWRVLKGWSEEEILNNWKKINAAVLSTDGIVITYEGQLINAFFHASSPVKTENSYEIWGKEKCPYLVSVENVESEDYINRYSTLEIEKGYFEDKIKTVNSDFSIGNGNLEINSYTDSGRVRDIIVNDYIISAEDLRKLFGLKSTLFTIQNVNDTYIFSVVGYGHGIGMSQVGADYLAKAGKTYEDIIKYYYTRSRNK